jgi:hypothetical protein
MEIFQGAAKLAGGVQILAQQGAAGSGMAAE